VTHASHGQAGTGTDEHPHAPHPQHARRPRTKLASAILGVVLAVLSLVAGAAIYQMRQTNLQLSEANQLAAAASSTIQTLQSGQAQDAVAAQSASSVISSLQAANQSMSSQLASAEQASTSLPPSKAGSIYHQAQVTLDVGQDPIDITAPPSDPTWGADASYGPDQRNALSYSARGLRINASNIGVSGAVADYQTCSSRTDYGGSGYVDTMTATIVFCVRFSDRFGAIKVLDSTTGTVTLELTTWER
jgi:hypothetical protein